MLILRCPYCNEDVDETDLHAGGEAHLKRYGPGSSDDDWSNSTEVRSDTGQGGGGGAYSLKIVSVSATG